MKKVFVALMILVLVLGLGGCVGGEPGYEVSVENRSGWSEIECVEFYDLTGTKKAEASIKDGKASADLDDGSYIVLVKDAPESVDYDIILLTSAHKSGRVTLSDAEKSGIPQYSDRFEFSCGAIVLDNGAPQPGLQVLMCTIGDEETGGFCLMVSTDQNGLAQIKVSAMEYHVSILTEESGKATEINQTISAKKRFYIVDLSERP